MEATAEALAALVATFAVEAGSLRWQLSWSGPVQLIGADGVEVAVDPAAVEAAGGDTAAIRALLTKLGLAGEARLEPSASEVPAPA